VDREWKVRTVVRVTRSSCETIALNKPEKVELKIIAWWLPALAIFCYPVSCSAQTGTVTFYSYRPSFGQSVKAGLIPPGSRVSFTGWLFDGDKRIVHASQGRFVTLRLTAGGHDFSAKYKGRPKKPDLHLDVDSGHHYCVRLSTKILSPIVAPIAYVDTKVEEISCQNAIEEAGRFQPLDLKRIEPAVRRDVETSATFPREN
jgi:hypothetical protein